MQYLLTAYDATDGQALERRMEARPEHLDKIAVLKRSGAFLFGGAILDDTGKMVGSMIVYDVPDREALDDLLKNEPYFTRGIWKNVRIEPFRLANIL